MCYYIVQLLLQYSNPYGPMVFNYGIRFYSNIEILQRFQNKVLRIIVDASWYATNDILHQDLNVPYVRDGMR